MSGTTLHEHLFAPGPKRILSLDGGGLRGMLTLAYLQRIEDLLRQRHGGDSGFRLSDYFDLIGGTSTGAIIASLLATRHTAAEIRTLYLDLGRSVFRRSPWRFGVFSPKFETGPLKTALTEHLGDVRVGSPEIATGLALVSKRFDTGSLWPIHNNPRGKYFEAPEDDPAAKPNKELLLRDVVRASCAAPHYFEPEAIEVGNGERGAFIDGGVSPFNNPALLLVMLAHLDGYGLGWPLGEEELLLVSVGTGRRDLRYAADQIMGMSSAFVAMRSLSSILEDCNNLMQLMLQWLARSPAPRTIDAEVGDLAHDGIGGRKWATYLRYDAVIESRWLKDQLDVDVSPEQAAAIFAMDRFENAEILSRIGREAAHRQVLPAHFPARFD